MKITRNLTLTTIAAAAVLSGSLNSMAADTVENTKQKTAQGISSRVAQKAGKARVAIALGGGGTRGAAHLGVLKVLEREGIPIDCVTGCSMGAIIGGLYCAGVPLSVVEEDLRKNRITRAYVPFWVRNSVLRGVAAVVANATGAPGLTTANRFARKIDAYAPGTRIENMSKRFSAVCTDLKDGRPCNMTTGGLGDTLATSSALPPLIKPVKSGGHAYVDGGITANLPVKAAREFGADVVIGVSVDEQMGSPTPKKISSMKGIADRMAGIALSVIDHFHAQDADLLITPDVANISLLSRSRKDVSDAIRAGEIAAESALPEIRRILKSKGILDDNVRVSAKH